MWFNGYGEFVGEGRELNRWIGWDLARFNGERLFGMCLIFEGMGGKSSNSLFIESLVN